MEQQHLTEAGILQEIDARLRRMVNREIRAKANSVLIASIVGLLLWPLAIVSLIQTYQAMKLIDEEGRAGEPHRGKVSAARIISFIGIGLLGLYCIFVFFWPLLLGNF